MRYFLFDTAIIFVKLPPVLGDSNAGHPLVQLALRVHAEVPDVLWCLDLDLRMLDGEAELGGRLVLLLPAGAVVNLEVRTKWFISGIQVGLMFHVR